MFTHISRSRLGRTMSMRRRLGSVLLTLLISASVIPATVPVYAARHGAAHARPMKFVHGTLVLNGSMSSTATIQMTGAFSVGRAINLDWDLPLPASLRFSGYTQVIDPPSYVFSVAPTSFTDLTDKYGHQIRRFHWDSPPANTVIKLKETLHLTVSAQLSPFHSAARYPVSAVSPDASPYLVLNRYVRLPGSANALLSRLTRGKRTEQAVVEAVANWVASNTIYSSARANGPFDAGWVFSNHQATCRGFDDLMAGMLRTVGIPAQIEYGWVAANPLYLPGPQGRNSTVQWSMPNSQGELHTWLNVYFPDVGWVPFDPQLEKFFVDTRHFGFLANRDAGYLNLGSWSAESAPGDSPAGAPLPNGSVEMVPGDGFSSKVTVATQDNFHVGLRALRRDISTKVLFSR